MENGIGRSGIERYRISPGSLHWIVPMMLLPGSLAGLAFPQHVRPAVYECIDAAGKPILTNKPANLHKCHMISGEVAPDPIPLVRPPPANQESNYEPSSDSPPVPNPGASSSPSTLQPCDSEMDPASPLGAPPCIPSGQSGAQPPREVPTPSP
jgi:hypothetical protein